MATLIFTRDVRTPLTFLLLALLALFVGTHLSRKIALALLLGLPLLVGLMSITLSVGVDPSHVDHTAVLIDLGGHQLHFGALLTGLATALRLASFLVLALLAGLTTTGPDLVRALVQHLHVPYRIGYTALAALRFVPRFAHELEVIRSAHRVRGVPGRRGPIPRLRQALGYATPLLAGAIRHAERVALAMDSRAFGAHPHRTERHTIPFRIRDWLFIATSWLATATIHLTIGS